MCSESVNIWCYITPEYWLIIYVEKRRIFINHDIITLQHNTRTMYKHNHKKYVLQITSLTNTQIFKNNTHFLMKQNSEVEKNWRKCE